MEGKRSLNQEIAKLVKAGLPKQLAEKILADMRVGQNMLYHLEEYGKYVEITGFSNVSFALAEAFLKANRKQPQTVNLQFFDQS